MMTGREDARPCLALMGEFSAGKSTLANLLIGAAPLPVQVVATQLPPVCISYGDAAPYAVDVDGSRHNVRLEDLDRSSLDDIAYLQIFHQEEILQHCDLLDMPGISDPNMSSDVWERMIGKADGVLWCSHATQAWRQSEAAVWEDMPASLRPFSLLLLTRADKLRSAEEVERVLKRVRRETEGLFADVMAISLLTATQEQSDYSAWSASGAEAFADRLIQLLANLNAEISGDADGEAPRLPGFEPPPGAPAVPEGPARSTPSGGATASCNGPRVLPRRIDRGAGVTPRPESPTA